jgi:hypothetical protein
MLRRLLRRRYAVRTTTAFAILACWSAGLSIACGGGGTANPTTGSPPASGKAAAVGPQPRVITLETTDSVINMPETIESGWVTLELKNTGPGTHLIQLRRATSMPDAERLLALERDPATTRIALDAAAPYFGGVAPLTPGTSAQVTMNIPAGIYNVADDIPVDGIPNYQRGLARTLTVTAANAQAAREPVGTATLTMKDHSYSSLPSLPTGQSTIKFLNDGPDSHTAIIARLSEGKTVSDAFQRLAAISAGTVVRGSGPLWESLGGLEGEGKGLTAYVTVNLQAGDYIFFCGLTDAATGKTHAALGMVSGFNVK